MVNMAVFLLCVKGKEMELFILQYSDKDVIIGNRYVIGYFIL